jgi:hypothetical protein
MTRIAAPTRILDAFEHLSGLAGLKAVPVNP